MILEMLRWWYGPGWMQTVHRIGAWTAGVEHAFSISLLLRTLFSPWRRIVSSSGRSLDAKVHDTLDNFVSRCVGFVVRCVVLLAAAIAGLCTFIGGVVVLIIWPLLPLAVIGFLVKGLIG